MTNSEEIAASTANAANEVPISPEPLAEIGTENYTIEGNVLSVNTHIPFTQFAAFTIEVSKLEVKPTLELEFVDGKQILKYTFVKK